jgi:hypothetical protein
VGIAHRTTLVALALCAVTIALWPTEASAAAGSGFTIAALVCAVAAIFCRQLAAAARIGARVRRISSIAGFAFAGSTGLVAVALIASDGPRATALLYTLAGAIFAIRPPAAATSGSSD